MDDIIEKKILINTENRTSAGNLISLKPSQYIPEDKKSIDLKPTTTHYKISEGRRERYYAREVLAPQSENTRPVLQSTYSVANGETGKRFLATSGAGPCVIATLHDQSTNTGIMTHFDSRSLVSVAMRDIAKQLGKMDLHKYNMRIIGGYQSDESSQSIVQQLRGFARFKNIQIIEEDVLQAAEVRKSANVVLDTMTGELYDLPDDYLKTSLSEEQRQKIAQRQTEIMNDPLVAIGGVKYIGDL